MLLNSSCTYGIGFNDSGLKSSPEGDKSAYYYYFIYSRIFFEALSVLLLTDKVLIGEENLLLGPLPVRLRFPNDDPSLS